MFIFIWVSIGSLEKLFLDEDFAVKEKLESRRQDLKPNAYIRSGSIYAMSRRFIMNEKRYYSGKSLAYILPMERTINIDNKDDLAIAKFRLEK